MRVALGDSVHVYTYNSTISRSSHIKCHLELAVTNSLWGFSVYIQEISLGKFQYSGYCVSPDSGLDCYAGPHQSPHSAPSLGQLLGLIKLMNFPSFLLSCLIILGSGERDRKSCSWGNGDNHLLLD